MINSSTAITKYVIQKDITEYPVGFKYSDNADGTPQLAVNINGGVATYGKHWTLSQDRTAVIVLAEEQYGATLTIMRDIPFVQESDYQVGRIDPEQIEADFDASVERDQMLLARIGELHAEDCCNKEEINELRDEIESLKTDQIRQDNATKEVETLAKQGIADAKSAANAAAAAQNAAGRAQRTADGAQYAAEAAQRTADEALTTANEGVTKAEQALEDAYDAQVTADLARREAYDALDRANEAYERHIFELRLED